MLFNNTMALHFLFTLFNNILNFVVTVSMASSQMLCYDKVTVGRQQLICE